MRGKMMGGAFRIWASVVGLRAMARETMAIIEASGRAVKLSAAVAFFARAPALRQP